MTRPTNRSVPNFVDNLPRVLLLDIDLVHLIVHAEMLRGARDAAVVHPGLPARRETGAAERAVRRAFDYGVRQSRVPRPVTMRSLTERRLPRLAVHPVQSQLEPDHHERQDEDEREQGEPEDERRVAVRCGYGAAQQ